MLLRIGYSPPVNALLLIITDAQTQVKIKPHFVYSKKYVESFVHANPVAQMDFLMMKTPTSMPFGPEIG